MHASILLSFHLQTDTHIEREREIYRCIDIYKRLVLFIGYTNITTQSNTISRPCSRGAFFDGSRGADALLLCDRKHGCALEIGAFTQTFVFWLASDHRDQKNRTATQSAIQRSSRRQQNRHLLPTDRPCLGKCVQVSRSQLAGVAAIHACA